MQPRPNFETQLSPHASRPVASTPAPSHQGQRAGDDLYGWVLAGKAAAPDRSSIAVIAATRVADVGRVWRISFDIPALGLQLLSPTTFSATFILTGTTSGLSHHRSQ